VDSLTTILVCLLDNSPVVLVRLRTMPSCTIRAESIARHRGLKSTEVWDVPAIIAALHRAGWSLRRLSIQYGYRPGTLQQALHRPYPAAELIIAGTIGVSPADLWPARYRRGGQ
jgi:lambda repressor-like predicted transcriptional regulator